MSKVARVETDDWLTVVMRHLEALRLLLDSDETEKLAATCCLLFSSASPRYTLRAVAVRGHIRARDRKVPETSNKLVVLNKDTCNRPKHEREREGVQQRLPEHLDLPNSFRLIHTLKVTGWRGLDLLAARTFASLNFLTVLDLACCSLEDEALAALSSAPRLQDLRLRHVSPRPSSVSLATFARTTLRRLTIRGRVREFGSWPLPQLQEFDGSLHQLHGNRTPAPDLTVLTLAVNSRYEIMLTEFEWATLSLSLRDLSLHAPRHEYPYLRDIKDLRCLTLVEGTINLASLPTGVASLVLHGVSVTTTSGTAYVWSRDECSKIRRLVVRDADFEPRSFVSKLGDCPLALLEVGGLPEHRLLALVAMGPLRLRLFERTQFTSRVKKALGAIQHVTMPRAAFARLEQRDRDSLLTLKNFKLE
jgi:hypothetical protein